MKHHFIHTCSINRLTTTLDTHNNSTKSYTTVASSLACRLTEKTEKARTTEFIERAASTRYLLLLPAGTDLRKDDVVVIGTTTYRVSAVILRNSNRPSHVSAELELPT